MALLLALMIHANETVGPISTFNVSLNSLKLEMFIKNNLNPIDGAFYLNIEIFEISYFSSNTFKEIFDNFSRESNKGAWSHC